MFPKTGKKLPPSGEELAFAAMMSEALVGHLGQTHQAVKIVMRWTGASERSVKHWLAGVHAPRGRSEEHTSELQSLMRISYAVFCLKKKKSHDIITSATRKEQLYIFKTSLKQQERQITTIV